MKGSVVEELRVLYLANSQQSPELLSPTAHEELNCTSQVRVSAEKHQARLEMPGHNFRSTLESEDPGESHLSSLPTETGWYQMFPLENLTFWDS